MKESQTRLQNLAGRICLFRDWWKVVAPFNRFYNKSDHHEVTLRSGVRMYVRDIFGYDLPIIYEVFGKDVYHLQELDLPSNATVFDVGAHVGSFAVAVYARFPDARITAFEPHPDNFAFLAKNAPFAVCVNKAVAGESGTVHLGDHKASSSYALGDTGIPVEAVTLDSYIQPLTKIDLLKVDVEGAEKDIFNHLSPESLAKVDRIMMEVHPPHAIVSFAERFRDAGLSVSIEGDILSARR